VLDLINFIVSLKTKIMKKSVWTIVLAIFVLISIGIWFFLQKSTVSSPELFQIPILIVIIGFGVFIGVSRFKSVRKGEPAEDELSKKLLTKASSFSFYATLYWLLILMYLSDRIKLETHSILGIGILGMAVLFVLSWIFFKIKGLKDDE
jgi:hypothetical protein